MENLSRNFDEFTEGPLSHNSTSIMTLLDVVLWCSAFGLVAVAIIIGNSLTIAVFTRKKVLRSRANYFLISLAAADLMVGVVTLPMYMYILVAYWEYGKTTHIDFYFTYMAVDIFSGFASIFALTIIAIERLYAIIWPLKHRVATKRLYHFLVSLAWILSAIISIFYYLFAYKIVFVKVFFYLIIFFIFSSLTIICIAYVLIWIRLKVKLPNGRKCRSESQSRNSRDSYRDSEYDMKEDCRSRVDHDILLTTLCIVTFVFVITWVPFYILNIVVFFGGQMNLPEEAFYFSKLLHYSNSLVNPIVYSIRIPRFSKTLSIFVRRKQQACMESFRLLSSRYTKSSSSQSKREVLEIEIDVIT